MNATEITHERGERVCRESYWIDIVRFFLLNYGLHAVTVVAEPGSRWVPKTINSVLAIFVPSVGLANAFQALYHFSFQHEDDLDKALRAGALCMLVPRTKEFLEQKIDITVAGTEKTVKDTLNPVLPIMTSVHGQYPKEAAENTGISTNLEERWTAGERYCLVQVPPSFKVFPLNTRRRKDTQGTPKHGVSAAKAWDSENGPSINRGTPLDEDRFTETNISCNSNAVKSIAALLQILYASFELYRARGNQLQQYGYAAYSLTVIPYILMSIANLVANCSQPQYPSMFIVHYDGKIAPDFSKEDKSTQTENNKAQTTDDEVGFFKSNHSGSSPQAVSIASSSEGITSLAHTPINSPRDQADSKMMGEEDCISIHDSEDWWVKRNDRIVPQDITTGAVGVVYGEFVPGNQKSKITGHKRVELKEKTYRHRAIYVMYLLYKSCRDFFVEVFRILRKSLVGAGGGAMRMLRESLLDDGDGIIRIRHDSPLRTLNGMMRFLIFLLISALLLSIIATPYVIIQLLTGFRKEKSIPAQRAWIMCWIVIGQLGATVASLIVQAFRAHIYVIRDRAKAYFARSLLMMVFSVPTIGGFIVVARMIADDKVCRIL